MTLPWLQEAVGVAEAWTPEHRAAALAARMERHPNWNWRKASVSGLPVRLGSPNVEIGPAEDTGYSVRHAVRVNGTHVGDVEQSDHIVETGSRTSPVASTQRVRKRWRGNHLASRRGGAQTHTSRAAAVRDLVRTHFEIHGGQV